MDVMAVFMLNICKYKGCGITFPRLSELIEHIEDVHIDYDPAVVEQKEASQPSCIPLSYVLKFFTEASRREIQNMPPVADVRRRLLSAPKTPSVRSSTPTGSDMDEDDMLSPSEDSNDSWTTVEEYSSEYILRYGVNRMGASAAAAGPTVQDKPFACPVPGCKKRYKNVNGIKYHSKNGHKKDGKKYQFLSPPTHSNKKFMPRPKKRLTAQEYFWKKWVTVKKAYKCQCGKNYKTAQGLKSHSVSQHMAGAAGAARGGLVVTAAPPALVVTAAPARPLADDRLVRIYDALKPKDLPSLPTFTIPKHNLTGVSIVRALPLPLPLAPPDRVKFERVPNAKVTVQARPLAPPSPMAPLAPLTPYGDGA